MKQQRTNKMRLGLQALVLTCITGFALFGLLSFKAMNRYADFWGQLGITRETGNYNIRESFLSGYFHYSGRNLRNIIAGDRVAVAKDLLAYSKQYVNTAAFAKEYETWRMAGKPTTPEPAKTADEIRKRYIDDTKQGIANMEKYLSMAKDEYKKRTQETIDRMKKTLQNYEDPNSEMIKIAVKGEQSQYEWRVKDYGEKMKEWEEKYPAGVKALIKVRLQQMLAITQDVDFNAELTERNGKKYFVNKDYQRKPANWKLAFRAGKEVTNTVRAFATEWLKELQ